MGDSCGNTQTRLIINYLPQSLTDKVFNNIFAGIGVLESYKIMRDFKTGYSYGFGFVTYVDPDDAQRAIEQLNGLQVGNKRIKVSYARPPGEKIKDTNLYITNLPTHVTEFSLEQMFGKFGKIVQKNILYDKATGLSRGVAFVRYDTREQAQQAIDELHGVTPEGGTMPLSVKVAEEHGKQKAAYYAGMQAGIRINNSGGRVMRGRIHTVGLNKPSITCGSGMRDGGIPTTEWNESDIDCYDY